MVVALHAGNAYMITVCWGESQLDMGEARVQDSGAF